MISAFVIILGYLLGSIPSAYIAARVLRGRDIRDLGDRNMGAANAYREIGHCAGVAVFIVDVGKGAAAVSIAMLASLPQSVVLLSGVASVVGHNWPLPMGFKGGRGAATTLGVLAALLPFEIAILIPGAVVSLLTIRNATLALALMFAPLPFVAWWKGTSMPLVAYSISLPVLVGFTHFLTTRRLTAKSDQLAAPANNQSMKQ